jgi:hypothetical protein
VIIPAIHIRGLDERTARRLKEEARRRGVSVNRFVVSLLERVAGTAAASLAERPVFHDLDPLIGTWSNAELRAFGRAVAGFEQIDEAIWK